MKYYFIGKLGGIVYRIRSVDCFNAFVGLKRVRGQQLDDRCLNHLFNAPTLEQAEKFQQQIRHLEIID